MITTDRVLTTLAAVGVVLSIAYITLIVYMVIEIWRMSHQ